MSKRVQEPVDQWLAKEGYFRKPTPRDPTCLFRAISEQIYYTQYYHLKVRKECTDYMMKMRHFFEKLITVPFDHYLKEMQCFTEWGGLIEIRAMSLFYRRNIIIFVGEKQTCETIGTSFPKNDILLCRTNTKQYESVYPMSFVQTAAYCQSLVYEVVYKDIFKMPDITTVADKMLRSRNSTLRHDRFFQKGNLGIREQLTVDLYNKIKNGPNDADEVQYDWKGIPPPIPYKVAKALAYDYYRNIELDIWCELKREVKSAGWSRFNSNELQVGGKCLIEITVNELEQFDRNNNKKSNKSLNYTISDSNNKIVQQQLKQGLFRLCGYIQEISTDKEPVLVFIEDLGEKKLVPYSALKPFPVTKRNRQKNWTSVNRNHTVNSDSNRRWKKTSTSFSRKKKDAINLANITHNTTKTVLINDVSNDSIDNVDNGIEVKTVSDIDNDKTFKEDSYQMSENEVENGSKHVTDVNKIQEEANNFPVAVTSDNLQSNNVQETAGGKKTDAALKRKNIRSKETQHFDHDPQNSISKQTSNKNEAPYNDNNSQTNMSNVAYYIPDNGFYPYVGNFGDHGTNQVDQSGARVFYNLRLRVEDSVCTFNYPYYPYGQNQGLPALVAPMNSQVNDVPSIEENIDYLVTGMQNCSLHDRTGAKETSKPSGNNKMRNRPQNFRGPAYTQHSGQQSYNSPNNNPTGSYDTRRQDVYPMPPQHQLDSSVPWPPPHQVASITTPNSGPCLSQYTSAVYPTMPYHEPLPPHFASEGNLYYAENYPWNHTGYLPVACLPPQHAENSPEGAAMPSYPQHAYQVAETYLPNPSAGYPPTNGHVYPQPMMYPQPLQYALPPPPLPPQQMQEQWNSCMGQSSYVQYAAPAVQTIAEPSSGVQNIIPHSSL